MPVNLGIIGCGKMAYALVKGILSHEEFNFAAIYVNDVDPTRVSLFKDEFKSVPVTQPEVVRASDIIILAVKPQQVQLVLDNTRDLWTAGKLLISIAAGIKLATMESCLGQPVPVIRVMPNTPCLVGEGVSVLAPGAYVAADDMELARQIFATTGFAAILEEKYMDAVTAVSGSGPAYIFLMIEAMINAAVQVGLDINLARQLVINTTKGSVRMLEQTGQHPALLREQVSSPAGTTIAAIRQLEENGLRTAFYQAIDKAYQRSIELGQN